MKGCVVWRGGVSEKNDVVVVVGGAIWISSWASGKVGKKVVAVVIVTASQHIARTQLVKRRDFCPR